MGSRRTNNRERILQVAGAMLYRQGYNATSVDDIVQAAGVSKSNFYYHYPSKEDLGIAVLTVRRDDLSTLIAQTLHDSTLTPTARMTAFLTSLLDVQESSLGRRGCPFGNLAAEMTEHSERIRCFLSRLFSELSRDLSAVVAEGQRTREFRCDVDPVEVGSFMVQVIQGMHLILKCDKDPGPVRLTGSLLVDLLRHTGQGCCAVQELPGSL